MTRPDGRDERRAIAGETVRIVGTEFYLARSGHRVVIADAVRAAVAGTRHHPPHEDLAAPGGRARTPVVEVTDESTLVAAPRPSGVLRLVAPLATSRVKSAVAANLDTLKRILETGGSPDG